jgi:hypothetical protein
MAANALCEKQLIARGSRNLHSISPQSSARCRESVIMNSDVETPSWPERKVLTAQLIKAGKSGDDTARNKLIELNMDLIEKLTKKYRQKWIDMDALQSAAQLRIVTVVVRSGTDGGLLGSTGIALTVIL